MSGATREHHLATTKISDKRLSRSMVVLSRLVLLSFRIDYVSPTTPLVLRLRFGLIPVRSPLLRESHSISFPPVTKMFQFTGLPTSPHKAGGL